MCACAELDYQQMCMQKKSHTIARHINPHAQTQYNTDAVAYDFFSNLSDSFENIQNFDFMSIAQRHRMNKVHFLCLHFDNQRSIQHQIDPLVSATHYHKQQTLAANDKLEIMNSESIMDFGATIFKQMEERQQLRNAKENPLI